MCSGLRKPEYCDAVKRYGYSLRLAFKLSKKVSIWQTFWNVGKRKIQTKTLEDRVQRVGLKGPKNKPILTLNAKEIYILSLTLATPYSPFIFIWVSKEQILA